MYTTKGQAPINRLNQSDQPIRPIQIPCRYHNGSICLNYCHELSCFRLLCEQCIEQHLDHHKKNGLPITSIKSFKKIREGCADKVSRLIQDLLSRMSALKQPKNPQQILEQANMKFQAIKKLMFQIIEQELARFYQQLRSKVNQSFSTLKSLQQVHDNLHKIINQLKQSKLIIADGLKQIPQTIQKVLAMNQNLYVQAFSREAAGYAQKLAYVDFDISMNQNKFKNSVSQCLKISRNQHEDPSNNSGQFGKFSKVSTTNKQLNIINTSMNNTPINRSRVNQNYNQNAQISLRLQSEVKYMHFFETGSNILHLIDLSAPHSIKRQQIQLSNYVVPSFYSSIITAQKYIFISGGIIQLANEEIKSDKISRFWMKGKNNQNFKKDFAKVKARSSHSICQVGDSLYILGGYGSTGEAIEAQKTVQKVNIVNGDVELETKSRYGGANIAVTLNNQSILKASEEGVQIYSISMKRWSTVQVPKNYLFVRSCGWSRISKQSIFVYGGYNDDEIGIDLCKLWTYSDGQFSVKNLNIKLPHKQGFLNNPGAIIQGCLYALQNISSQQSQQQSQQGIQESQRALLKFDGNIWKQIKL